MLSSPSSADEFPLEGDPVCAISDDKSLTSKSCRPLSRFATQTVSPSELRASSTANPEASPVTGTLKASMIPMREGSDGSETLRR